MTEAATTEAVTTEPNAHRDASGQGSFATIQASFAPIQASTLVNSVYDTIRAAILNAVLPPGVPVRESLLASQMRVSRAPVREAMRRLEQGGLVTKSPNKSYFVTRFSDRDIYELATVRAALETLGARQAMRDPETLEQSLRERLADISHAITHGDERMIIDADRAFHEVPIRCSGNHRLALHYATLRDQTDLCLCTQVQRPAAFHEHAYKRHEVIVDAVASRDIGVLVEAIDAHIREGAGVDAA